MGIERRRWILRAGPAVIVIAVILVGVYAVWQWPARQAVAPGDAYMAPTDSLVHDASTIGARSLDITLTFRAKFKL